MTDEIITPRAEFDLPYGRSATFKGVKFESGLNMLRLTLRENRRFTIIDLDAASARALAAELHHWANENSD
jgi:hypothetical protein